MTEYNGQTITYDKIGNPLTYRDGMTMTWKRGRQLTALQTEGNSIQYKYDSDSIRTSKIVNGVVHTYEYLDGLLMHETRGEQAYDYYYDANGQLYAVSYKLSETDTKKVYYFTHNWRGDIVGIYNGNGDLKATYEYDAWGNVVSIEDANGNAITSATHIANLNPFRYRGYYMDTETGLYYLMSRYYDPVTHRFVNADGYFQSGGDILDTNMNAYCGNNSINYVDPTGECYIHTSWYVPTCKICGGIPITPKPINPQKTISSSTKGSSGNKNFGFISKFGNEYTEYNSSIPHVSGTYNGYGSYVTVGETGDIANIYGNFIINDFDFDGNAGINVLNLNLKFGRNGAKFSKMTTNSELTTSKTVELLYWDQKLKFGTELSAVDGDVTYFTSHGTYVETTPLVISFACAIVVTAILIPKPVFAFA